MGHECFIAMQMMNTILSRTTPLAGPNRGRELALGFWIGGSFTSSAHVPINPDATVAVYVGSVDLTSTRTTILQGNKSLHPLPPTGEGEGG